MKYKLTFSIDSEALFGIMARMLPIEDLAVEELNPIPPLAKHTVALIAKDRVQKFRKPKGAPHIKRGMDLTEGVNAVLMSVLQDAEIHRTIELRQAMGKNYSPTGLGSKLDRLVSDGYVTRLGKGQYRITALGMTASKREAA